MLRSFKQSFLVTCVGAYDGSGLGTGGFVCVNRGKAFVVDRMDSTGLFFHRGMILRFVRSLGSLFAYDPAGLRLMIWLPAVRDVHDLICNDSGYVCASTGTNSICWFDWMGRLVRKWHAKGESDAWHLNCLCAADNKLYLSAFGEFSTHREWTEGRSKEQGFVMDVESGQKVLTGLSGPHSPRYVDGIWYICESHRQALTCSQSNRVSKRVQLNGFTRGLWVDAQFLYVGQSANRKTSQTASVSHLIVIDRKELAIVGEIEIPFPEIYEIVAISDEFAAAIEFHTDHYRADVTSDRLDSLELQVKKLSQENKRLEGYLKNPFKYALKAANYAGLQTKVALKNLFCERHREQPPR